MRMCLPVRLFISYAVYVVVIGAAVTYVTVRLLAPTLFDQHMTMLGGDHMGPGGQGGTAGSVHAAFISALTTALGGYAEGLIDGVFAPEPETLGAISDELRRLGRLADDLSALSRAEERRLDLHPADADLAGLARRAAGRPGGWPPSSPTAR